MSEQTTKSDGVKNKQLITTVVVALIVGVAGFFGGTQYQKTKRPAVGALGAARGGVAGAATTRRFGAGGNNFVSGTVQSQNGQQITIQLAAGGSRIVILPPSAQVGKFAAASSTDISVGNMVTVTGTDNSDGSITAQNVQIRPPGMPGPGGGPGGRQPGN